MKKTLLIIIPILIACFIVTILVISKPDKRNKQQIFVSIEPYAFLVESIVGDKYDVNVLINSGTDPHHFELTPKNANDLSQAKIYFANGFTFEDLIIKKLKSIKSNLDIVELKHTFENSDIDAKSEEDHENHAHDQHYWMSPRNLKNIANIMLSTIVKHDKDNSSFYKSNFDKLITILDKITTKLKSCLNKHKDKSFYVYHSSLGFFAKDFELHEVSLDKGGKEPTLKEVDDFINKATNDKPKFIFVQPQYDQKRTKKIADKINAEIMVINPLDKNIFDNYNKLCNHLIESFNNE